LNYFTDVKYTLFYTLSYKIQVLLCIPYIGSDCYSLFGIVSYKSSALFFTLETTECYAAYIPYERITQIRDILILHKRINSDQCLVCFVAVLTNQFHGAESLWC